LIIPGRAGQSDRREAEGKRCRAGGVSAGRDGAAENKRYFKGLRRNRRGSSESNHWSALLAWRVPSFGFVTASGGLTISLLLCAPAASSGLTWA